LTIDNSISIVWLTIGTNSQTLLSIIFVMHVKVYSTCIWM